MKSTANSNLYPWKHDRPYNDFSTYIRALFKERIQKISIDAGFTCPNRDGSKGTGGCTFCDNKTFNPSYCLPENTVTNQLDQGISFFKDRYKSQKYLAYFQAYSNSYASLDNLKILYGEALSHPDVIGIVIGTRPDCIPEGFLEYLDELSKKYFVSLEFGLESTLDHTLKRINRGHTFEELVAVLEDCSRFNFKLGLHLILGLPGEKRSDIMSHAATISKLNFDFLKLHQLQIIRGTKIENEYKEFPGDFIHFTASEYIKLTIQFLELLNPEIILERFISQSPPEKLIAPKWGLKNFEFTAKLENEMKRLKTWQGRLYNY